MPIYEYRCEACGELFEQFQKITDDPLKTCTLCGGQAHRIISKSTFILKGSGWYATDYASKDKKTDAPSSTQTETKTETATASDTAEKSSSAKSDKSKSDKTKSDKKKGDKSSQVAA